MNGMAFAITMQSGTAPNVHSDSNLSHNGKQALSVRTGWRDFSAAASHNLTHVFGTTINHQ
jgi:hypothetical protein